MLKGVMALVVLFSLSSAAWADQCRTITLPDSNMTGGGITIPPSGFRPIEYTYPTGATRVGLEFWMHQFPAGAPPNSQYLLVYLNDAAHGARRIFHAQNSGPEYGTGWVVNFPLSTFMHPGEELIVGWLNNTSEWQNGYLIVTIQECYP